MCHIAEVLISLQQVGNVKYIEWKMTFSCQKNLVEDLRVYGKNMEEKLEEWKEEVKNARNEFYELNYYTTHQLLVLRRELGRLKASVPLPAQVMALLQSISCDITPNDVETAVERRKTTDREKLHEEATFTTMESSFSKSYQQPSVACSPTNLSEEIFASADAQSSHTEEDTSEKKAKLSVSDLDEKQLNNFINLTEKCRYPEQFALKAIEECSTGDWYDIMDWVEQNNEMADEMMQSADDEASKNESEEEEEEEEEVEKQVEQRDVAIKDVTSKSSEKISPPGTCVHMYIATYKWFALHSCIYAVDLSVLPYPMFVFFFITTLL